MHPIQSLSAILAAAFAFAATPAYAQIASEQPATQSQARESSANTAPNTAPNTTTATADWLDGDDLLLLALAQGEELAATAPQPLTLRIYWENDGAQADPTDSYDRGYTNGLALTFDHQPDWADHIASIMPFAQAFESAHSQPRTAAGYVIGQQFFTPRNISTVAAIPGDQPYAGYLYGGIYWQRQAPLSIDNSTHQVFDHFEINLGVVGNSSLAEDIQTVIHDQFNSQPPNGWDNQLKDEFTYQLYYRRKWRFDTGSFSLPLLGDLETQLIPHAGFALGNVHRNADVGITARIGFNLPDDFGAGRINDLRAATGNTDTAGWAWFAWGRVGGRYVQHNTFLDGSNTQNPSPSVNKNPFVGEAQLGLAIAYHDGPYTFEFTWAVTFLTDDFDAGTPTNAVDGTVSYGTLTLSLTQRF